MVSVPKYIRALTPSLGIRSLGRWVVFGVLVGIVSGLGAALFHVILSGVGYIVFDVLAGAPLSHPGGDVLFHAEGPHALVPWLFFLLPAIGGLAAGLIVQRFAPEAGGVGTEALIEAFHKKRGQIRTHVPLVKAIATIFTLGFGGASGREGPIAQIGGGFGSWLARVFKLKASERRVLLLAGAAGGFGAIFRAPLGGAITAVEILYREDLETDALVPCVISSVTAYSIFTGIFGFQPIFHLPRALAFTHAHELLFYLVLGLLCVPLGALTVKVFWGIKWLFDRLRAMPLWILPAMGGLLVGILGLYEPRVYGSGWGQVQQALDGSLALKAMLVLMLGKIVAMSLTLGSGGSGGVFGPTLFIGAMLGGIFGGIAHKLLPGIAPDPASVIIVSMCAFFAGVANAPLGALLMTVEISGSYGLVAPLMLVSVIAVLFTSRWSIFRNQVENKFHSPAHQGDLNVNVLHGLTVGEVMRPAEEVTIITSSASFRQVREIIARAEEAWFPVVSPDKERPVGVLSMADARPALFEHDLDDLLVAGDIMSPPVKTLATDNLYDGLLRILDSGYGEILVTSRDDNHLLGVLRHADLLRAYHREIAQQ